jgi:hypothetical protein
MGTPRGKRSENLRGVTEGTGGVSAEGEGRRGARRREEKGRLGIGRVTGYNKGLTESA